MSETTEGPVNRSNLVQLELASGLVDAPRHRRGSLLQQRLRDGIRTGVLAAGTMLPATRGLAEELGVSRGVIVRAYEQLVAEGYLTSHQGRGTQVASIPRPAGGSPPPTVRQSTNPGLPGGASFPRTAWLRAAEQALRDADDAAFAHQDPAGYMPLREALSRYLGRTRAVSAPAERIVITNGFARAGRLLTEVLMDSGHPAVALEDPGSRGLRDQLTRCGIPTVGVPVDEDGLRVDALATHDVRAVVVTPAHQFPTGAVMSPERRRALVEWARTNDGIVIEDDYDAEHRWDRHPVGAVQGLSPDHVAYGGSTSKTLAPALRLGWLVLPRHLVTKVAAAKYDADLATGLWGQMTLAALIDSGDFDRHIRATGQTYRDRRDQVLATLRAHLPDWRISGTAAGLHAAVVPPPSQGEVTAFERHLAGLAASCGVDARPLRDYCLNATSPAGLVLGYGQTRTSELCRRLEEWAGLVA